MKIWECRYHWIILQTNKYKIFISRSLVSKGKESNIIHTLKIVMSLFIFTLLFSDSLSFSDDVAKTTRTGRMRRSTCLSGKRSAKSNSKHSAAYTIRTWRMSSTLSQVKELKRTNLIIIIIIIISSQPLNQM